MPWSWFFFPPSKYFNHIKVVWGDFLKFCCWVFCFSFCITRTRLLGTYHSSMTVWRVFCISTPKRNYFQGTFSLSAGRIVPVCIQNVRLYLLATINLRAGSDCCGQRVFLQTPNSGAAEFAFNSGMLKIPVWICESPSRATFSKCCTLCSQGRHKTAVGYWSGVNLEQWDWFSFLPWHWGKASSQSCLRDSPLPQSVLQCCLGCPEWL